MLSLFRFLLWFQGIPHPVPYGDESNPRALTFLGSRSLYIAIIGSFFEVAAIESPGLEEAAREEAARGTDLLTVQLTSVLFAIECVSAVIESVSAADLIYKELPSFDLRWDEYKGSQLNFDYAYPSMSCHFL